MSSIKEILKSYLILILLAFFFEIFFIQSSLEIIYNFIENILFATIIICPFCFLKNKKTYNFYFIVSYFIFSVCLYFESIYFYLFKTYLSSSAIFVALDTNLSEAKEFVNFYVDNVIIISTIIFFNVVIFLWFRLRKLSFNINFFSKKFRLINTLIGFSVLVFLKATALIIYNFPYLILKSSVEYYTELKKLGNYEESKNGDFNNIYRLNSVEDEIYVVILGESTNRSHMGLYDYYRNTTPNLNKIKEDLLIYKNVISPHAYSVGSLTKILTLGNYENPKRVSDGSIIQLANSAGFTTYWLSNQRPIGSYESMITKITLSANEHKFLTTSIAGHNKVLDENLIPEFNKIISNDVRKKVVFIHLMGTHHHYENRYPETFNKFKDTPKSNFISNESYTKINHYDNAVLYNDYIISNIIKSVNDLNIKSFVVYFSDHGEEMFTDLNMAGHNEDLYTKSMFDIPLFLWMSQDYKDSKKVFFAESRKYMIDDFFHSSADLLGITADEVDLSRSVFSDKFIERKRIIKDTIDYDVYFK